MHIYVIGGRLFSDAEHAQQVLDFLHGNTPIKLITAEDPTRGAGKFADEWAKQHGVPSGLATSEPQPDMVLVFNAGVPRTAAHAQALVAKGWKVIDAKNGAQL